MANSYKLRHDRSNCIGCSACASIAPDYWGMAEDGKSKLSGAKKAADGMDERDIGDKEFADNKRAADSCPVNVIHIVDSKGKKLV